MPSKALLRPVIALADARRVDGAREAVTGSVSAGGAFGRRNRYVSNWNDNADGHTGRARMVVDSDRGHLLGVTLVGPGVTELLHSATIAVAGQVPVDRLWHAVACFPTISELWLRLRLRLRLLEAYRDASDDN